MVGIRKQVGDRLGYTILHQTREEQVMIDGVPLVGQTTTIHEYWLRMPHGALISPEARQSEEECSQDYPAWDTELERAIGLFSELSGFSLINTPDSNGQLWAAAYIPANAPADRVKTQDAVWLDQLAEEVCKIWIQAFDKRRARIDSEIAGLQDNLETINKRLDFLREQR